MYIIKCNEAMKKYLCFNRAQDITRRKKDGKIMLGCVQDTNIKYAYYFMDKDKAQRAANMYAEERVDYKNRQYVTVIEVERPQHLLEEFYVTINKKKNNDTSDFIGFVIKDEFINWYKDNV